MPFRRTANALLSKSAIEFDEWMDELRQQHEGIVSKDHVGRIAKGVLRKCDPKQYLLSHATIVASVDTYAPKGAKVGKSMERGFQIDVRNADFRIKPVCQKIINNNGDAWERSLLLSTYKTFISAPNYLEHIQIPELSKGFIVDAIARDLGETCYIDILVATDRKHQMLVRDITSGNINAMSMGCISLFTTCTKCGNVAADDTQLCPCILYDGKNKYYTDQDGQEHRLAELIGHVSVPNSNQFIEASWVRNPAFVGAARRNFLNAEAVPSLAFDLARVLDLNELRAQSAVPDGLARAASVRTAEGEQQAPAEQEPPADGAGDDDAPADDAPPAPPPEPEDKLQVLVDQAQQMLMETIVKGLGEKLAPKPSDVPSATPSLAEADLNETLFTGSSRRAPDFVRAVRRIGAMPQLGAARDWALRVAPVVAGGRSRIRSSSLTPRDLVVFSWISDTAASAALSPAMYQTAMQVGPSSQFPSETSYLAACRQSLGRKLTDVEVPALRRLGRIASLADKF